eukprot:scpid60840/ scgid0232/ Transmembrane protein 19
MGLLRYVVIVWAIASVIATIVLVDQKSYGGRPYYLVEHLFLPCAVTLTLAIVAVLQGWLDVGGAAASLAVGLSHSASHASLLFALLAFFVSSSCATSVGKRAKKRLDPTYKKGGQRNIVQVFSNGAVATSAALSYLYFSAFSAPGSDGYESISFQFVDPALLSAVACMAALAGCCGDTWASEFGILQGSNLPRHVLTLRPVPAGTNGGISFIGTACSLLGGLLVGVAFFVGMSVQHIIDKDVAGLTLSCWPAIPIGALSGLLCSTIDSILGATLQYSGRDTSKNCVVNQPGPDVEHITGRDILDNHAVNFLSSLLTALIVPAVVYSLSEEPWSV